MKLPDGTTRTVHGVNAAGLALCGQDPGDASEHWCAYQGAGLVVDCPTCLGAIGGDAATALAQIGTAELVAELARRLGLTREQIEAAIR